MSEESITVSFLDLSGATAPEKANAVLKRFAREDLPVEVEFVDFDKATAKCTPQYRPPFDLWSLEVRTRERTAK